MHLKKIVYFLRVRETCEKLDMATLSGERIRTREPAKKSPLFFLEIATNLVANGVKMGLKMERNLWRQKKEVDG